MSMENKKVNPVRLTDRDTHAVYVLEFSRESVIFTNKLGFDMELMEDNIEEMLPILFYGAFRKNHKEISRANTDKMLFNSIPKDKVKDLAYRLLELYAMPRLSMFGFDLTEEELEENSKNASMTVEL